MEFHLIVRHPFGDFSRGDRITDPAEVTRLAVEVGDHVTRVAAPTEQAEALPTHQD